MEKANLRDDLKILQEMYPEMVIDVDPDDIAAETSIIVRGSLPFKISLPNDVIIRFNEQSLTLSELTSDLLTFSVKSHEYPDLSRSLDLEFDSEWMTQADKENIKLAVQREFCSLTDCNSELYDPFTPLLMLLFGFLTGDVAAELFKENQRVCHDKKEFDSFAAIDNAIESEKLARSNFECPICMETKKGSRMTRLPCGHRICELCVKSYYTSLIEEGSTNQIRCPNCEYRELDLNKFQSYNEMKKVTFTPAIPFSFFRGILSPEVCLRYEKLFYSQAAARLSQHCANACVTCRRCDTWCVKDDLNDSMMICTKCEHTFCFDCLHSWHGYINHCGKKVVISRDIVEEYLELDKESADNERRKILEAKFGKKNLELEANDYLADQMIDHAIAEKGSNLQRCPKCRTVVQRSEGCNKMKCAVCEIMFCFLCGVELYPDDPYEHFRVPYSTCYARLFEGMAGVD
ncbi:hypothetical protein HG536_0C05930 [Torulaspora globosa]|uniref:RBR-type E3 ubiquitin transferase n=1 Tax=Torulaspora globosa TaxID=48254 RepID=A0A7G3ZFY8_9SACH|nr:uncharacterized protein HG536_0C05930 [Torulaspora globosa]QLL32424.1 hypothetical protein HG536_0C05930 [Torulaspora globosa]